jgi:hypothetical protein
MDVAARALSLDQAGLSSPKTADTQRCVRCLPLSPLLRTFSRRNRSVHGPHDVPPLVPQVLTDLAGDKSLERFRIEYEKLYRTLKKSHGARRRASRPAAGLL